MSLRRLFPVLAWLAASATAHAQRRATPPPPPPLAITVAPPAFAIEKYALANGLEVVLHEDHSSSSVAVNVWYHVGSKDEAPHRNGFAHLFEHLMFQGSRHVEEDTFFRYLEEAGNSDANGSTNDDWTNYYETLPAGRLELALWLESDRMAFLLDHVNQETFASQREVVLNERREGYEDAPYGEAERILREAIYPAGHPYHRLTIGTPEDLNAATLQDVKDFFRTWYVPNNATLVIAGDFEPAATKALVEQYFGPILRGADVPRAPAPTTVALTGNTRLEAVGNVQLPKVFMVWPTPALLQPGDAEADLLAMILASGRSSRLVKVLVEQKKLAQDVSVRQESLLLGSQFVVEATVAPGHTAQEVLDATDAELQRLRTVAPTLDELTRARTTFVTGLFFSMESLSARADRMNLYNLVLGTPHGLAADLTRYQRPTPADLLRTAQELLPAERRVVLVFTPDPNAPVAGRLKGS